MIKNIAFIIMSIPLIAFGGLVLYMNATYNPPHQLLDFSKGVNPQWAVLILSSLLSLLAGILLIIKGIEGLEKRKPSENLPKKMTEKEEREEAVDNLGM